MTIGGLWPATETSEAIKDAERAFGTSGYEAEGWEEEREDGRSGWELKVEGPCGVIVVVLHGVLRPCFLGFCGSSVFFFAF